ncbi:hypothetical protein K8O68_04870 [Salipaludibacillus sp. CUR1]|uniref:hypothetical protein n=1 Tax=Salipaludibacillus sp. CUR1 TaxID=2820003 RepID=UPI001E3BD285|nr:hypothetical protein [Salipaludibacillus sp. CUR1]MCE7791762.1 hypothetical protein [Salipaludibacillus sp. CUR1]
MIMKDKQPFYPGWFISIGDICAQSAKNGVQSAKIQFNQRNTGSYQRKFNSISDFTHSIS